MAILAFGDEARAWARRFDEMDDQLIIVDPSGASSAFLTAIETKKRGEPVLAAIALDESRSSLAWALSATVLNKHKYRDDRMQMFEEIANHRAVFDGKPMAQMTTVDPRAFDTLRDFARMADVLVVRSWSEATRITRTLGIEPAEVRRVVSRKPLTLPGPKSDAEKIVLWAPELQTSHLGLLVYGLLDFHRPLVVICKSGTFRDPELDVRRPQAAGEVLADAAVVIDASLSDPHDAIELTRLGHRVATPMPNGAHEYVPGVSGYVPWMRRSIRESVQVALGRSPTTVAVQSPPALLRAPELRTNGPLTSLIVRTYNRPRFLERALESIASQTYRDIEAVVVNDAGEAVDDVVARFPFARLVVNEKNLGTTPSANVGLRAARGTYVGLLDDDDMIFPDHVSRLVDAMERIGGAAANSHAITCYLELTPFSDYAVYGYRVALARHIDRSDIYVRDPIAPMSMLMRRSVLEDLGGFEESVDFAEDWELWIRIAEHYDVQYVPYVTGIYSVRTDATNTVVTLAARFGSAYARIVELHPLVDRPQIDTMRQQMIDQHRGVDMTPRWGTPAIRFEPPRPLP
ncbi:MAG TPA: glycosyltransferase [Candidatus Baltobacteraceae bacterium]